MKKRYRLKKWVKVVLSVAALGVITAVTVGIMKEEKPPTYSYNYTVKPGDTLWDIAQIERRKDEDVRLVVYRIKKRNNIKDNESIHAGDSLVLELPK